MVRRAASRSARVGAASEAGRTGTLRRSCESCRRSKIRCIPLRDVNDAFPSCERCSTFGISCIFEQAIARPRQVRHASKSRRRAVEEKIDGLVTLISSLSEEAETRGVERPADVTISTQTTTIDISQDVIFRGILTIEDASRLLADFIAASAEFPLVLLPFRTSLEYLRLERPFLLLAILTACARDRLQTRLEVEFRKVLAERVIVNAEKNVDLLHGLLVFLSWNHLYFDSAKDQMYQFAQIATTMAMELRLGPPESSIQETLIQHHGIFKAITHDEEYYAMVEKMRAYVMCYYVSSSVSLAMRKPTHFKYVGKVAEYCRLLSQLLPTATNGIICCFVRCQALAEEVEQLFQYNSGQLPEAAGYMRVQVMVNTLLGKLDQLVGALPPEAKVNSLIQRKCLYLRIYIHEVGLRSPALHENNEGLTELACCSWSYSLARLDVAISCVRAAQTYINEYVLLPPQSLRHTVLFQESELLYAILVLAAATLGGVTVSDPGQFRELADIPVYLTSLRDKMMSMGTMTDTGQERRDYFWKMMQFFKHCLNWIWHHSSIEAHHIGDCAVNGDASMSFERILENVPSEEVTQDDSVLGLLDIDWILSTSEF